MDNADSSGQRLRSDAARNRERILAAAADLFATQGLDASIEEIAARAGVGVGTVYRRFTDRDGLIDALFEERIDEVAAIAERALKNADPWDGLESFLRETSALHAADRGFQDAVLSPGRGRERVARSRDKIAPLAAQLLQRAHQDGRLREDFDVFDVPMLQLMLGALANATRDVAPALWQRFFEIFLDGMRTSRQAPTQLSCEPLHADDYARAMAPRNSTAQSR